MLCEITFEIERFSDDARGFERRELTELVVLAEVYVNEANEYAFQGEPVIQQGTDLETLKRGPWTWHSLSAMERDCAEQLLFKEYEARVESLQRDWRHMLRRVEEVAAAQVDLGRFEELETLLGHMSDFVACRHVWRAA